MRILIIILIVMLAMLQYRLWFGDGGLRSVVVLRKQVAEQKALNQQLQERNKVLMAEIQDLKSGRQAVEERARSDLGMVKNGETFYQVVK
jgi:cell division protein FtsB